MERQNNEKSTGIGSGPFNEAQRQDAQGLARCEGRGIAGAPPPSSSDCYKIGTWNVRSLNQPGKMGNVLQEMVRMKMDILGVAETFWDGNGEFSTNIPGTKDSFRVLYSGGDKKRRGVGVILRGMIGNAVMHYEAISDRIMLLRLQATPVNMLVIQVYAPCEDEEDDKKDKFYEMLDQVIADNRKGRECLIVMGDFNGKVGENREEDIVGPFGLGSRNENGQYVVDFCTRHKLHVTNTWFQQKISAQHTWVSPDGVTKNQIDYVLVDKRFRQGVRNSKSMPGADCGSDHNPVITTIKIKLRKMRRTKPTTKWNLDTLNNPQNRCEYQNKLNKQLKDKHVRDMDEIDQVWDTLKECIEEIAEEICEKEQHKKKQNWMTAEILHIMEERRRYKNLHTVEGDNKYKEIKHSIQKLCREAKDKYFNDKCKEIEILDKCHNQLLYKKVKALQPKGSRVPQVIKDKTGKSLMQKEEILERWAEYVEELYEEKTRTAADMGDFINEVYTISENEIREVIGELPMGKACREDNIPIELLQCMEEEGIETITRLINMIYKSGYIPEDFRKSIFVPLPKVTKAQDCSDYRTIALISHASKILLQLIKIKITPIIERQL